MKNTNKLHSLKLYSFVLSALSCAYVCADIASAAGFEYSGDTGPGFWHETTGWETCGRSIEPGARQTPINIDDVVSDASLQELDLLTYPIELSLMNNGHTIEQEYADTGSKLFLAGLEYELLQFHFHTLSEHTVDKKRGAMELHAVFKWTNGQETKLAVIGVIYQLGKANAFLQTLIDAGMPTKKGDSTHTTALIDLQDALTDTTQYYIYDGSLTTPPCSEIVTWIVLQKPSSLSKAQFRAFNHIMGNNFRPLQALNKRTIRGTASP